MEREQIIKALECWTSSAKMENLSCEGCYFETKGLCEQLCTMDLANVTLALINELTQANEQLSESYDHLEKTKDELLSERARLTKDNEGLQELVRVSIETQNSMGERIEKLTEENERLRGVGIPDNEVYIRLSDAKHAIMEYACNQTVSKYASAEICKAVRSGAEGAMNELDYITPVKVAPIADTVRKMQERIKEYFPYDADSGLYVVLDQIANEILEGNE